MDYFIDIKNIIDKFLTEDINNEKLIKLYFKIGEYLVNKKELKELELFLKSTYGLTISFTKRNLINMINFYKNYQDNSLKKLTIVSWTNHLKNLKQLNFEKNNIEIKNSRENINNENSDSDFLIKELLRIKKDLEKSQKML